MNEENMKITIHYIWFKDYRGFKNQGINFSSEYEFKYDPDDGKYGSVSFKDNRSEYIEGFFGKNIDVTAIVGQNGIGKTSLLRFIQSLKTSDKMWTDSVIIYEKNSQLIITKKYRQRPSIKFEYIVQKCDLSERWLLINPRKYLFPLKEDIRYIYLTEMFNMSQYTASEYGDDDLSFASVLFNQTEYGNEEEHVDNPVTRYIHRINEWQLAFLSNGREYVERFKIKFPPYLNIDLSYDENSYIDLYSRINSNKKEQTAYQKTKLEKEAKEHFEDFMKFGKLKKVTIKDEYATAILMNIISSLKHVFSYDKDEGKHLFNMIENIYQFSHTINAWDFVYELLKKILENNQKYHDLIHKIDTDKTPSSISINAKNYIAFMDYFQKFISKKENYEIVPSTPYIIKIPTENTGQIYEFFEKYKQCISTVDFLSFSWGLSSGETLLLNQFGKLMHLLKKNPNGSFYLPEDQSSNVSAKNTVIMLDEAEVAFHPEWQRIYFKQFLKFVEKNIAESGTHVQIIIATHSPIMLSDIPRQNTLLLKKDEAGKIISEKGEETFAANIFSLYHNSFFIDDTGIGAFAKNMLEDIVKAIHKNNQKKTKVYDTELMECSDKELMKYIESVGDVYLRAKLKQEFFMYRDMDKKTKEDIKVNQMRAKLRENYKEIAKTKAELKKKDDEVAKKKAELEEKDVELAKKNKELEELKKKVEALTNDQN